MKGSKRLWQTCSDSVPLLAAVPDSIVLARTVLHNPNGLSFRCQKVAWTHRSSPSLSSVTSVISNYSAFRWIAYGSPSPPNPSEISGKADHRGFSTAIPGEDAVHYHARTLTAKTSCLKASPSLDSPYPEQMEPFVHVIGQSGDLERGEDLGSGKGGGDSNAIILRGKRRNKTKGKSQVHEQLRTKKNLKLTKCQKRKLNKIAEEKEKALLLSKSIETLEKYKIQDDAYSLMWSSRNLSQVETVRERRRRAVQLSKVGLAMPHSDQPFKRKAAVSFPCEIEPDSDTIQSTKGIEENNFWQPVTVISEIPTPLGSSKESFSSFGLGAVDGYGATIPAEEVANRTNDSCVRKDAQDSFPTTFNSERTEINKPMDRGVESPKMHISNASNLADCPPQRGLAAPVVVHVSRKKEVENKRKDLPIVMWEQEIMEAINENSTVIICGKTGCGKTTQVPQFLYEAGFGSDQSRSGIIGVTQPRRIAAYNTAERVADELGLCQGKEVGYQVRHDRRIGDSCSIKFMTDGILLRELQSDVLLKKYSIIILDEAHERSLNTDILIGMLS